MGKLTVMRMKFIADQKVWRGRAIVFFVAGFFFSMARAQIQLTGGDVPDVRRDATVVAVEKVMPCVVNIATKNIMPVRDPFEEFYRQFLGGQQRKNEYSLGSGVVIDDAG